MGSLSYGELAGERMKLGLLLHDPEEEQDCFSDNTYNSHYNDMVGIMTGYTGEYTRLDGKKMTAFDPRPAPGQGPGGCKGAAGQARRHHGSHGGAEEARRDGRGL